ncbi:hypothetical protein [Pseudoalteromonas sp. DY56-GL79]|uniref:hypothetical protein n=1 Tax=Pseudoalteromonas sp. DY56-GL79 TaxID=2967131 RepID=UPI00352BAFF7
MGNFLSKNLSLLLTIGGIYYIYKYIDSGSKSFTEPLGNLLAKFQFELNGSHDIERSWAGFFLDPDKLDDSLKVKDSLWISAIKGLNPLHADLLHEIFDADWRLKPLYRPLIGGEVSPQSIATINKR